MRTTTAPKRRELEFHALDDVRRDVDALHAAGYHRLGNWTLGQTCEHLGIFFRGCLDGFTQRAPWYTRPFGGLILRRVLRSGRMPTGVKVPADWLPGPPTGDDRAAVEHLVALLARFEQHAGPLHPSPLFGPLSRETWARLHLIHCAHHLSFLVPAR